MVFSGTRGVNLIGTIFAGLPAARPSRLPLCQELNIEYTALVGESISDIHRHSDLGNGEDIELCANRLLEFATT